MTQSTQDARQDTEEFEVEAILGMRDVQQPGKAPHFYVKWLGWPHSANTWEPLENLGNCAEIFREFLISSLAKNMAVVNPLSIPSSSSPTPSTIPSPTPSDRPATPTPTPIAVIDSLTQALQEFEDIFSQSPGPRIAVENDIDHQACPEGFTYLNTSIYGSGVQEPDMDFSSFCRCEPGQCAVENGCDCMIEAAEVNEFDQVPFEKDGRVSEKASRLLWECNSRCGCGPSCISKASQNGRKFALKIKRFPGKGWGVVLNQADPIPPRTCVARYTGEIITIKDAEERERHYKDLRQTWLFDLDYNAEGEAVYTVDAYKCGNESHFFNHSCDPNLSVYMLGGSSAGDLDLMIPSFWSNREIRQGEELTFDYTGRFVAPWLRREEDDSDEEEEGDEEEGEEDASKRKSSCMCGAASCRKWISF